MLVFRFQFLFTNVHSIALHSRQIIQVIDKSPKSVDLNLDFELVVAAADNRWDILARHNPTVLLQLLGSFEDPHVVLRHLRAYEGLLLLHGFPTLVKQDLDDWSIGRVIGEAANTIYILHFSHII